VCVFSRSELGRGAGESGRGPVRAYAYGRDGDGADGELADPADEVDPADEPDPVAEEGPAEEPELAEEDDMRFAS
jgi:hypothetical protein